MGEQLDFLRRFFPSEEMKDAISITLQDWRVELCDGSSGFACCSDPRVTCHKKVTAILEAIRPMVQEQIDEVVDRVEEDLGGALRQMKEEKRFEAVKDYFGAIKKAHDDGFLKGQKIGETLYFPSLQQAYQDVNQSNKKIDELTEELRRRDKAELLKPTFNPILGYIDTGATAEISMVQLLGCIGLIAFLGFLFLARESTLFSSAWLFLKGLMT